MVCSIHMVSFLLWKVIDDVSYDGLQLIDNMSL